MSGNLFFFPPWRKCIDWVLWQRIDTSCFTSERHICDISHDHATRPIYLDLMFLFNINFLHCVSFYHFFSPLCSFSHFFFNISFLCCVSFEHIFSLDPLFSSSSATNMLHSAKRPSPRNLDITICNENSTLHVFACATQQCTVLAIRYNIVEVCMGWRKYLGCMSGI